MLFCICIKIGYLLKQETKMAMTLTSSVKSVVIQASKIEMSSIMIISRHLSAISSTQIPFKTVHAQNVYWVFFPKCLLQNIRFFPKCIKDFNFFYMFQ